MSSVEPRPEPEPPHSGFATSIGADVARSQARMSLALVGLLGLAIVAVAIPPGAGVGSERAPGMKALAGDKEKS